MAVDQAAIRAHINGGGNHDTQIVGGYHLGPKAGEVIGIRVTTKGRVKPLNRNHTEFILWGDIGDTATTLWAKWRLWLAEGDA